MADIHTRGIILRKTDFGDNDIIFDLLNEEGKVVGFFTRGAKKIKSRFAGVIQLGHVVSIEYSTGKNLNYPKEITIDRTNLFSFYAKSISGMNFYTDLLTIARSIAKDLEDERLFFLIVAALQDADKASNLVEIYNQFLKNILELIGIDTDLKCYYSGEIVTEKEFYYQPEVNKVISKERKPKSIDLPLITRDEVFQKVYLRKLILEHINQKLVLKF